MNTREIVFLAVAITAGVALAATQSGWLGGAPSPEAEQAADAAEVEQQADADVAASEVEQTMSIAARLPEQRQRKSANRDYRVRDVEGLEALGLESFDQFIDYDDDWGGSEPIEARGYAEESWGNFSEGSEGGASKPRLPQQQRPGQT